MRCYLLQVKEELVYKLGFSLIEILVYIMLLSIIMSLFNNIIILNKSSFIKIELEKIYIICLYLQKKALLEQKEIILILDINNNSYQFDNIVYKLEQDVIFGIRDNLLGSPGSSSKMVTNPISFNNSKIIFYPDGIISSGSLYLTNHNKSIIYSLTCAVSTINYLRKYKFNNNLNNWILIN